MTNKLEPLDSQIMTGYMLSKARAKYLEYMDQAFSCMIIALEDTQEQIGEHVIENVDLGAIRSAMYDALAGVERVEVAHKKLSKMYQKLGYRKLTTDDFARFGGTRR